MFKNLTLHVPGYTVLDDLEVAKRAGYDGLEVKIEEIARLVREKSIDYVEDIFAEAGVVVGGWCLPSPWIEDFKYVVPRWEDVEFTWRGGEERQENLLRALPGLARISQQLGCRWAYTWILTFSDERDYAENFDWHVKQLRPLVNILKDFDVRLGLEWQAPLKNLREGRRYDFIDNMGSMLELCRQIESGKGSVGLLVDSWHWHLSGGTLEDLQSLRGEQVAYVHICDAPPGIEPTEQIDLVREVCGETGVIDLVGFLKSLQQISFDGPITPSVPGAKSLEGLSTLEEATVNCRSLERLWREMA